MIRNLYLENFMLFSNINFEDFTQINLFIGENDTGKTSILKVLYSISSGVELYSNRTRIGYIAPGYNPGSELFEKITGTFYTSLKDSISPIKKNCDHFIIKSDIYNNDKIEEITIKQFEHEDIAGYQFKPPSALYNFNAVFIPPKEILSIKNAIKYSQTAKIKDFDDTYLDLVTYIENPKKINEDDRLEVFRNKDKYDFYNGFVKLIDDNERKRVVFIKNKVQFEIGNVAEGIKKLGIFPVLEKAGYLTKKTILFIDEPENSIHPKALRELMRFLFDISKDGVQIFMASHNQFVVQQLRNFAKINKFSINCYSLLNDGEKIYCKQFDLKEEMAENPILDEAVKMFDESVFDG